MKGREQRLRHKKLKETIDDGFFEEFDLRLEWQVKILLWKGLKEELSNY